MYAVLDSVPLLVPDLRLVDRRDVFFRHVDDRGDGVLRSVKRCVL